LVAIAVVGVVFTVGTNGLFVSSGNLANLGDQTTVDATVAIAAVAVMVLGEIDLSPGSVVAFCAIVGAELSRNGSPLWATIVLVLLLGGGIGLWNGIWVAWFRVPSFVVTLATLLGFGALGIIVTNSATIAPSPGVLLIENTNLPYVLSVVLAPLAGFVFLVSRYRQVVMRAGATRGSVPLMMATPVVATAGAVAFLEMAIRSLRGLEVPIVLVCAIGLGYGVFLEYFSAGRELFAVGGSRGAARNAGVPIVRRVVGSFMFSGVLYGVAGLILVARIAEAAPGAESSLELTAIAAAVIGGTSLFGGVARVGGAVVGALLLDELANGMGLMNIQSAYQPLVTAGVLLIGVYLDLKVKSTKSRGHEASGVQLIARVLRKGTTE
jgi:ABC-type xylose transport system permease subunit